MAEVRSQKIINTGVVSETATASSSARKAEKKSRRERRERESVRLGEENIHLEEPLQEREERREEKVVKKERREKKKVVQPVEASTPSVSVSSEPVVVAEAVAEKKVKSKRVKKVDVAPVVVEEANIEPSSSTPLDEEKVPFSVLDLTFSKRKIVERDELNECFEQYARALENELEQTRLNKNRKVNVKTWRLLLNEVRRLKGLSLKVMKKPKKRSENAQSGFMKPVKISQQMAEFAGWSINDLRSRVEVTKVICNYIKENNLQNPSDRRQILVDNKLSKLLNHPKNSSTPLTYYLLQKMIQHHFTSQ